MMKIIVETPDGSLERTYREDVAQDWQSQIEDMREVIKQSHDKKF